MDLTTLIIIGLVMERKPTDEAAPVPPPAVPAGPDIHQQATHGGAIKESGITAPASSAAKINQQAKGKGSEIATARSS